MNILVFKKFKAKVIKPSEKYTREVKGKVMSGVQSRTFAISGIMDGLEFNWEIRFVKESNSRIHPVEYKEKEEVKLLSEFQSKLKMDSSKTTITPPILPYMEILGGNGQYNKIER